jgi:hypothetical protein
MGFQRLERGQKTQLSALDQSIGRPLELPYVERIGLSSSLGASLKSPGQTQWPAVRRP